MITKRPLLQVWMMGIGLGLWVGLGAGCGGGSACTQLSARCDKCTTIQQPGCKAVVAAGKDAACEDSLKLFDATGQCK